jgi:acetyl-CoA C-acetyltransferase
MKSIFITSAVRTGIGTFRKSLKDINAIELGACAISNSISKSNLKKNDIDEIIMGQVLTGAMGQNPARQAAIKSGIPKEKPAYTVNQVCGSGMRSIVSGLQSIKSNDSKIIVAGGQENMSLAPHAVHLKDGEKIRDADLVNMMIKDGLWDAFNGYHMGITAENIAEKFQISRDEQDKFALKSQEKSLKAKNEKKFKNEIVNLKIKSKKKEINFNEDEHPRYDVNLENLSKLKPIFKNNGTVTAGNASGINDGAAAVILMSEDEAKRRDLETLVSIKSWACCGVDPALMGTGPIPASKKALELAGWAIKDVDLFEINEAFAAQSIAVLKTLSIPDEKVNVNGGAISLGHPIGASGARILVTLIHEMIKRDVKKGLATLCIGGGMGITLCIER